MIPLSVGERHALGVPMKDLRAVHLTGKRRAGIHRPRQWIPRCRCQYRLMVGGWEWLIRFVPNKGRWAVGVRPRGTFGPHAPTWLAEEVPVKKRVVKGGAGSVGGPVHLAPVETEVLSKFPRLVEHLVTTRYADGEPRQPGLVMVDVQGATWRLRVTEPDVSARLTCLAESLDDALALAELHLGSDDAPWEVDSYAAARKKKK